MIAAVLLFGLNAFAFDLAGVKEVGSKVADKGKEVMNACKKEQVEHCKAYFELAPLKECLTKNKEKLSEPCKKSIGL